MGGMALRPYQAAAVDAVESEWGEGRSRTLLVLPTGCHAAGQGILMADGTVRAAEEIEIGDLLMGPDGTPREVLALHSGEDEMFRVAPVKGNAFTVNGDHVLSLVRTAEASDPRYPCETRGGETIEVTVREWLGWSANKKHLHKLYRAQAIESFAGNDGSLATVDPYFLGVLLGDGCLKGSLSVTTMDAEVEEEIGRQCEKYGMTVRTEPAGRATTYLLRSGSIGCRGGKLVQELRTLGCRGKGAGEKSVPQYYKTLPADLRAQVVAGLLDTDGSLTGSGYDFVSKSRRLSEDLAFMCRSLGLAAYIKRAVKTAQDGFVGEYWRVSVSGDCSALPLRVARKKAAPRRQKKDVLRTGFAVEEAGIAAYYGFTVDGDNLYLLDDFTVTHNCGKTIVFANVAKREVDRGGRVLVLAHRGELLDQAAEKIMAATGLGCSVEKAERTGEGEWFRVTVGSVQSMMRESRLARFPHDWFDAVVIDEAHHAVSDSYRAVLDWFPGARVLGVTATPDRADRRNLGAVFDSVAYEYTLPAAIRDGYLCPIKAQTVPLSIDLSAVRQSAGDFSAGDLGTALDPYLHKIADEMLAAGCLERRTVVFLPLVATSRKFRAILEAKGFRAAEVNGESEDRAEVLADFDAGRYDVLCNSMLLTEGWDCPAVDCVIVLRPTRSNSLYQQMVGRGTRLSPETGKTELLLLDFLWHTERHDLCRPAHLVASTPEVAEKMTESLEAAGCPADLGDVERQASADVVAQREEALKKELKEMRTRKRKLVDPLQYEMSIGAADLAGYVPSMPWEMAPATEKQKAALEKAGIAAEDVECAGKASIILDKLAKRRAEGLATPKQIRFLEQKGFLHVGEWPLAEASKMIGRIQANNWRVPRGVDPAKFAPQRPQPEQTATAEPMPW